MTKRSFAWRQRQGFGLSARDAIRPKYNRELWVDGPVRTEARRLASIELAHQLRAEGKDITQISKREWDKAITVLLFNSEDIFLKRAKWNLEERK